MPEWKRFTTSIRPLDLDLTLGCGQTFRWDRLGDGSWRGVVGRNLTRLTVDEGSLEIESWPGEGGVVADVESYLRASDDIGSIQDALSRDDVMASGIRKVEGLRLVKMDEWECLVSYVLATYSNIPRIRRMIELLSERYGEEIGDGVFAFPRARSLASATVDELAACGLGYRARYLHSICRAVDEEAVVSFEKLDRRALREQLKRLPGVGDKVADCVSLFGYGRLEAFPVDVWIERALARLYGMSGSYRKMVEFAEERFGPVAGYAQEYLYYNERLMASRGRCAFSYEADQ